jgi:hypothetical protein
VCYLLHRSRLRAWSLSGQQLGELGEQFIHDGFHFIADDRQSEHGLGGFTELRHQRAKGIADSFLKRLGKLGPLGLKCAEFGGDVLQFRQGCRGAGLVLIEAIPSVASLIRTVASLMSFVLSASAGTASAAFSFTTGAVSGAVLHILGSKKKVRITRSSGISHFMTDEKARAQLNGSEIGDVEKTMGYPG